MDTKDLIGRMTLEEKVGQLFMLAFESDRMDAAETLFGRYFMGASYLSNDNLPTPAAAAELTRQLQGFAAGTRLSIPVLLGADHEGAWSVMYPGSCPGPGNMALGATGRPEHARAVYGVIGAELRAVGLHAVFGPCADCNANPDNAIIGVRSFGEPAALVGDMTVAAVEGVLEAGAIPTLKHYPGHGDTTIDSHRNLPTVTRKREQLFKTDLLPFARGVAAGVPLVMTSHIVFTALDAERPATLSPVILGDVLRGELGFEGVIVTDSMNMQSMQKNYDSVEAAILAINAGVDMIMLAEEHYDHRDGYLERHTRLIDGVREAVEDGRISEARLDEAVTGILRLKTGMEIAPELNPGSVGSPAHRAVEMAAARDAMAILRGATDLLPASKQGPVTLVNTTRREAYEILGATRGIGPNQTDAAFDLFAEAVRQRANDVRIVSAEDLLGGERPDGDGLVVAVTESHPLPGVDFDQSAKAEVLSALAAEGRMLVVALRDPYELKDLPLVDDYVCAFGSRWCSAVAAAELLFGEIEARGTSPVSVPGTDITA